MPDVPDDAELDRLGAYDPEDPAAEDWRVLVRRILELGATQDDVSAAGAVGGLGSLSLDLSIRPEGESVDLATFEAASDLDPGLARGMWRALGFPEFAPMPFPVTPDIAAALRVLVDLSALVGEESAYAVARVVGSVAARLAEAVSGAFRVGTEVPARVAGTPYSQVVAGYSEGARVWFPLFLGAFEAVFRRHMVLVSYQMWSPDEEGAAVTLRRTVGFADLVGSTAAVRAGSPAVLARMVREFEERIWNVVTGAGGRVVKLIGDEAMFVVEDPAAACGVALEMIAASPHPVRVGLAHGELVALFGDYYGVTVNLAARLVAATEPSTVLVSEGVADGAGDAFSFEPTAGRELKGFPDPVVTYRLSGARRRGGRDPRPA